MHTWKKKLVVSQLALACTLAITSQANASTDISGTTYTTFTHYNDASHVDDVYFDGYVGCNNYGTDSIYNGDIYPVIITLLSTALFLLIIWMMDCQLTAIITA